MDMQRPVHNLFITEYFDWKERELSRKDKLFNSFLGKLGYRSRLALPRFTGIMTNVEQRINMYHLTSQVLVYQVPGDFVELGCNNGQSAVLFQKVIDYHDPSKTLHVYDSFEGLPELRPEDGHTSFHKGQMAVRQQELLDTFRAVGLKPPVIHAGWFSDTLPTQLPEKISFAHLDGDLYESIKVSLEYVYPRLSSGAICLVDDYCDPTVHAGWDELPGVKKACDEYLSDKPEKISVLYAGGYAHGFFRKH
jgi:O-methyltransferase